MWIETAVAQKIAPAGAVAVFDVALGIAVVVEVEVPEAAIVGVAAAGHDRSVHESATPLQVQQGRDVGVELRAEQPVFGGRNDPQIGDLEAHAPALVIARGRHEKA